MKQSSVDDAMVAYPLFQTEEGGSIPTSTHQFLIEEIPRDIFITLNRKWHSRLPECGNCWEGVCFGALHNGIIHAVAWWSKPISRLLNSKNIYELRRMALSDNCPKNTGSYMIKRMRIHLKKKMPWINKLISYQDTEVHNGTIYKASGWKPVICVKFSSWKNRANRTDQSTAYKIRWEYEL